MFKADFLNLNTLIFPYLNKIGIYLSFNNSVTLGSEVNISDPQLSHLSNGDRNVSLTWLREINEFKPEQESVWSSVYIRHSMDECFSL